MKIIMLLQLGLILFAVTSFGQGPKGPLLYRDQGRIRIIPPSEVHKIIPRGSARITSSSISRQPRSRRFQLIEYPGAAVTQINKINANGDLVGHAVVVTSFDDQGNWLTWDQVGFKLTAAGFEKIDFPTSQLASDVHLYGTIPMGLDNSGRIVGAYGTVFNEGGPEVIFHGFLFDQGQYTSLDSPVQLTRWTQANGVNTLGQIVGTFNEEQLGPHGFLLNSGQWIQLDFPWPPNTDSGYTNASDINDLGQIAGTYTGDQAIDLNRQHGFRLSNGVWEKIDFNGSSDAQTSVSGINNLGQFVGTANDQKQNLISFFFDGASYHTLKVPGCAVTTVTSISDSGIAVGDCDQKGFIAKLNPSS